MPPSVEIARLRKSFGAREVLRDVSLAVEPGTVFGYIGPNGAGKSTTVKILIGLLDEFEGEARVAGVDVRDDPREVKRRIGYVPESVELYEGLSALEYLQLVGRLHGLAEERIERRARRLLEVFELEARAHSRLAAFSKGMRQKVAFSAALIHDPEVLFLDEPLSGLDVASTILIKEIVRTLADGGKTVFYCSHMMDVVERVCDRILILHEGSIAADGSFEELSKRAGSGSLEEVFRRLTRQDAPTERVASLLEALRDDESG